MRRVAAGTVGLIALAAGVTTPVAAQTEGGGTCAGHPVTIHFDDPGVGTTITGTGGPDVIQGGPQAETINAGGGEDVVCGGDGSDIIDGGTGRDELIGQSGSDTFKGADLGQDVLTGGSRELDVADYALSTAGVDLNMTTGVVHATGAVVSGGVLGIEVAKGTPFDDRLIGGAGRDQLIARDGLDFVDGRGGSDILTGGPGLDRLSYATAPRGIKAHLDLNAVIVGSDADTIGTFEVLVGSPFADKFVGDEDNEHFIGGAGDDNLKGRDGNDVLEGGGGDDVIHPGQGDDFVDGGSNDPVTSSGAHGDLVSYQGDTLAPGERQFSAYLYTSQIGNPPGSEGIGDDTFSGVESLRGRKNGQNLLQGNDGPNVLIGGDGQDYLEGRGGNDLVYGLGGVDILNGDYAAGVSPGIFGDDYLDGGAPTGPSDGDSIHGNGGDDTCTGGVPNGDNMSTCETIF